MTRRNYITAIYVGAMSLLTITACKDRMRLYHKGYKPRHHANLRFDGYYFRKESPMQVPSGSEQSETWANPITPYFFCEDGSIAQYPTHKDEYHIKDSFVRQRGGTAEWGIYQTSGDTLLTEMYIHNNENNSKERFLQKAMIKKDKLVFFVIIDDKGKEGTINDTLYFRSFPYRPDTTQNYIKKR